MILLCEIHGTVVQNIQFLFLHIQYFLYTIKRRKLQKKLFVEATQYFFILKNSNEGKDSTSLSKLAVVGKKIRGFKIYFVNFLLLHLLSGFVEGLRLTFSYLAKTSSNYRGIKETRTIIVDRSEKVIYLVSKAINGRFEEEKKLKKNTYI